MKGPLTAGMAPIANRYTPLEWIGAGGMQNVYLARDEQFGRAVALKTPKEESGHGRFQLSAVISAKVNHPNVAKTLDYFVVEERPFLVEEHVVGADFASVMDGNLPYLPPSTCARVLHQLAKGLLASHAAGVVHRDLKPSNIMVVGGYRFHDVKITDFGIAKMAEAEIGQWAEVGGGTSSKTVLGAIPYMSPEAINDFKKATKPSDVWAIAAIVYQMLSGELPFGSGLKSIPNIIAAVPPAAPRQLKAAQFSSLGDELYDLICRCLDKDPEKRPDAAALVTFCEQLCYSTSPYSMGTVSDTGGYTGRIIDENDETLMYHPSNFYGNRKVAVGSPVWFGRAEGSPMDRAFPIVAALHKPT